MRKAISMFGHQDFSFVGGPFDGRSLPVPNPAEPGMELRVYPDELGASGTSYVLDDAGQFRHAEAGEADGPSPGFGDALNAGNAGFPQ